jgi:enoyl-[acyl-carrier protein] reductase III
MPVPVDYTTLPMGLAAMRERNDVGPPAGKIALVTGGSRGIGRAIAHKLAAAGCDVTVTYYHSHDQAEALCAEIRAMGRHACAIQGDLGNPESVEEILAEFRQHFDRLDVLVSNAATGVLRPALEMSLKHWRWCLETNALALTLRAQRAVPFMPAGGRIMAMSSLGATRAIPGCGFVGASKAALESPWCAPWLRSWARAGHPGERGERGGRGYRGPAFLP